MICKSVAFFVPCADDFALHYKITIIIPCNYAGIEKGVYSIEQLYKWDIIGAELLLFWTIL